MTIKPNKCFEIIRKQYLSAIKDERVKFCCNRGGSRSGKTFDAFTFLIFVCVYSTKKRTIRVFRQNLSTCLSNTFTSDFLDFLSICGLSQYCQVNKGVVSLGQVTIYFQGLYRQNTAVQPTASDILFFNEVMEMDETLVDGWITRCREFVIFDWNPTAIDHWVYDYEKNPDAVFTHTTFLDNKNLSKSIVETIKSREPTAFNVERGTSDEWMWKVYGLGECSEPVGMMYGKFTTYEILPIVSNENSTISCYVDVADTGTDYFCAVSTLNTGGFAYVLDVLFTQKSIEYTEIALAKMLTQLNVNVCHIESNSGGRGFALNVSKIVRSMGNTTTIVKPFYQSKNKDTRILLNSSAVTNCVIMPHDWKIKYKDFARQILTFKRDGKNVHDDAPDVLTGIVEYLNVSPQPARVVVMGKKY